MTSSFYHCFLLELSSGIYSIGSSEKFIELDTRNILFVAGGAFDGIQRHIARRLNTQTVGYHSAKERDKLDTENFLKYIAPQDLKSFGLIPELIGRMPVLSYLNPLDAETLRSILTEPKNAMMKQYEKLFAMDGITLKFDDDVLDYMVEKALEYKLGARGLRSICEAIFTDAMFELPAQVLEGEEHILNIDKNYAAKKMSHIVFAELKAVS